MKQKENSNKVTRPHKYRVSIYLGKDLYETLNGMARFLDLPMATMTKILLQTGVQIGNALDAKSTEDLKKYGKSKI